MIYKRIKNPEAVQILPGDVKRGSIMRTFGVETEDALAGDLAADRNPMGWLMPRGHSGQVAEASNTNGWPTVQRPVVETLDAQRTSPATL